VTARRPGRRPGTSGTREAILDAARTSFGTSGFAATTIRGVAAEAGVDPALVHHYFGTKQSLFAAAVELPGDPAVLVPLLLDGGADGLGERVVRTFLSIWDATPGQGPMLALLRAALADETAAASLRDLLTTAVLVPLAEATGRDDVPLRASLAASVMTGLALSRYVLRIEPLASADADVLAPVLGATIDRYLSGTGTASPARRAAPSRRAPR
jgi:AcrR family transcriptional regulator